MHLQQLVNDLASDLGASLLIEDREHRVVAFSPQFSDIDDVRRDTILTRNARVEVQTWLRGLGIQKARTPIRVPSNAALSMLPRVCVPVWNATSPLGYLWVIDTDPPQEPTKLDEVALAGARVALAWQMDRVSAPLTTRERSSLVHRIWSGSPAEIGDAFTRWRAELGLATSAACRPVLFRVALPEGNAPTSSMPLPVAAVRAALAVPVLIQAFWAVEGSEVLLLLPSDEVDSKLLSNTLEQASGALGLLGRPRGTTVAVRIGLGPAATDAITLRQSVDLARASAVIGDAFDLPDTVSQWESLGVHRAAYELKVAGMGPQHLAPGFTALLAADSDGILLATLERYLSMGCSARNAAAALRIHRTSLYYRLDRAASALGCDLSDGSQRLGLHLALLIHRLGTHDRGASLQQSSPR